jgi:hypothetical protein
MKCSVDFLEALRPTNSLRAGIGRGFHDHIDYNVEAEALGSVGSRAGETQR